MATSDIFNLTDTWNAGATTFTAIKMNVTDTASASDSLLMDLQVGGSSVYSFGKDGFLNISGPSGSIYASGVGISYSGAGLLSFGASSDLILGRAAAASLRLGAADAAAPVAQTLGVQSVVAGTSNTAGANLTIKGSAGTGTGAGGSIIFQVAPAGSTGTSQNAFSTALTIGTDAVKIPSTVSFYFDDSELTGFQKYAVGEIGVRCSGTTGVVLGNALLAFRATGAYDVVIRRDAANTLAMRNGATAQTSRIYGTYTDASNYRRITLTMSTAGVAEIKPEGAGTGASGNVIHISGLPTSNPGPGILWNNAGTPAIGT